MEKTIKSLLLVFIPFIFFSCQKEKSEPLENRTFIATAALNKDYCKGADYYELTFWEKGAVWYKHFADGKTKQTLGYPNQEEKIRFRYTGNNYFVLDMKGPVNWFWVGGGRYTDGKIVVEFHLPEQDKKVLVFSEY